MHLRSSQQSQEIRGEGKESIDNEKSSANPLSVIFRVRSKAFAWSWDKADGMEHQQVTAGWDRGGNTALDEQRNRVSIPCHPGLQANTTNSAAHS